MILKPLSLDISLPSQDNQNDVEFDITEYLIDLSKLCKGKPTKTQMNKEKTIITYKTHNGQDLPLPRYYKTTIYTDDQSQLLWLYAENKGVKWVNGFEVIEANTVNKDYYERLLKEKNENGVGLHEDNIEEIEKKKAINRMAKLQNLTNRKKAQRRLRKSRRIC